MNNSSPQLKPYERRLLDSLSQKFSLEPELIAGFSEDLKLLATQYKNVVSAPTAEFREGRVVVMGLINHTHHLLMGGLQAAETGNAVVWSFCFRGLAETFGACVLIDEQPGKVVRHLDHVDPGKLCAAAERVNPGLKADIKRLHQIVHPASGAVYAGSVPIDEDQRTAIFKFGLRALAPDEGQEAVTVLANMAMLIVERFARLTDNQETLSAGKIVMERNI